MRLKTRVRELLKLAISELAETNRPRCGLRHRRANIESLEPRTLLTAYSVSNLDDAGAGSLRDAISQANANSGPDTITFATSGTIFLSTGQLEITDSVTITGPGAGSLTISGNNTANRILLIDNSNASLADVSISGVTFRDAGDGNVNISGGAIINNENLTLTNVAFVSNDVGGVGHSGALAHATGNLIVSGCTFSENHAGAAAGGAIGIFSGTAIIVNSTISGNAADGPGGGIFVEGGTVTIRNSTITGNRSDADDSGGEPGGGIQSNANLLTMYNTIVAGNFRGTGSTADDLSGALVNTSSFNLIGDSGTAGGLSNGTNSNIVGNNGTGVRPIATILNTTLANNVGPTQTHALVSGSVAIDSGSNSQSLDGSGAPLITDQRGNPMPRIFNTTVDMGAYELFAPAGPIVVSTTTDELDNNVSTGNLSLREAILLANGSSGANTITFAASTNGMEFDLSLGQMEISATVTITGNGAAVTIIDAQQLSRILKITAGDVTLNSLTLKNGQTTEFHDHGGAVRSTSTGSLTINKSTLSGNSTAGSQSDGGAIFALYGAVTVSQSTLSGNSTARFLSRGGAIFAGSGAVTVSQSTLSGNSTAAVSSEGGAIFAGSGAVTVSQSTLSGNSTTGTFAKGGAIMAFSGAVTVSQSTLTLNSAKLDAGGAIFSYSSPVTIRNSIVAGNTDEGTAPDVRRSPNGDDSFTVTNSLIGRNNDTGLTATGSITPGANGNFIGGDTDATKINPQLGLLANNGGPTKTHALLTGSLAIDRGSNAAAVDVTNANAPLLSDQRGVPFTRVLDGDHLAAATVDMGAFEFSGIRLLNPNPNTFTLRPTFTWTPIAGATSYNIQINNESTNVAPFHLASSNVASYTPPADLAIGKFKMWIRPIFGVTLGNWSAPQLFNDLTAPTWQAMQRTQLTSRPTLNWNALPGAVKYDLWMDNFSTGQKQLIRQDVTGTSFTPVADLPMGLYRFWIRGVDAKGNFAQWSVLQEFLVVPGPTPVGPQSATFDRTPTFSWNSVAGAVSYELYVRNLNTSAMVINGQSVAGTNFTPASNLTDGPYRWYTLAVSQAFIPGGAIKSGGSNPLDIYIGGRPTFITPANGSSTNDRTPTFSWKPVDGAVTYRLQVDRINVPQIGIINQVGLASTSFTPVSDLPAGTYRAWVRAVSATNELSPWSIEVNFTVTESDPVGDTPGLDDRLAGLLVSELAEGNDTRYGSDGIYGTPVKVAVEQPQPTPTHLPEVEIQDPSHQQLDRLMMEFAMTEFLGERKGVSPPST